MIDACICCVTVLVLQNFTVLYIKMGLPRLPSDQQVSLLKQLVSCLPGRPEPQQNRWSQFVSNCYSGNSIEFESF